MNAGKELLPEDEDEKADTSSEITLESFKQRIFF